MDYETKMLLWGILRELKISNAVGRGYSLNNSKKTFLERENFWEKFGPEMNLIKPKPDPGCETCGEDVVDLGDKLCHSCYHTSCDDGECYCETGKN